MKLVVEIGESLNHGKYVYGIRSLIATDEREGDEIYDKEHQSGEVARLIGLSEKIEEVVAAYGNTISLPPIADKNSSTEDLTV